MGALDLFIRLAVGNLFHGALSDCFGRLRPSSPVGGLPGATCALPKHIETLVFFHAMHGMSTGAGIGVSRAGIRDVSPALRVKSHMTIHAGVVPAIAPRVGNLLLVRRLARDVLASGRCRRLAPSGEPALVAQDIASVAAAAMRRVAFLAEQLSVARTWFPANSSGCLFSA